MAAADTLRRLEGDGRIVFRYAENSNPNGAANDIAGIMNEAGNVIGMVPHPENMIEPLHGAADCRPLFESRCAGCHRFGAIGKDVGPDLTTITSRFKKRDILESVLWPSKVMSDQYQAEMFELTDGKVVAGLIVRENATAVLVRTAENPDKPVVVSKAQISDRASSPVSLMPEGLFDDLDSTKIADLLAFVMAPPPDK